MKSFSGNTQNSFFLSFLLTLTIVLPLFFCALPTRAEEEASPLPCPTVQTEVLSESTSQNVFALESTLANESTFPQQSTFKSTTEDESTLESTLDFIDNENTSNETGDDWLAASSEEQTDRPPAAPRDLSRFHRSLRERDLSIGYGKKIPLSRFHPRTKITLYQVIPRWGRFRDSRQEFLWELPLTYASSPETAYAAGLTLMYRYHLSPNRSFAPFVEFGSGFVFTNLDQKIRELSRSFNFSPQVGVGFRKAVGPSSDLVFSARWFHLSNAGTRAPNVGLNNYLLTVGYSQLF